MKYRITPIDPLISRDARPFGAGGRVRSLDWLTQTAATGAVRTAIWKRLENRDDESALNALHDVKVRGPFPMLDGRLYFPRPLDIVVSMKDKVASVWQITPRPLPDGCHVEMPVGCEGLIPAEPDTEEDFKPEKLAPFWPRDRMAQWLKDGKKDFELFESVPGKDGEETLREKDTLSAPEKDERIHVKINPATGAAEEGQLFSTTGLDFVRGNVKKGEPLRQSYAVLDVELPEGLPPLPERFIAPLGGERRLAEFSREDGDEGPWACPLSMEFHKGDKIRLVLASPAIFDQGWLPGWMDKASLEGTIPGTGARVKLISAVTGRWQPISGWGYEKNRRGPKPLRRAVPSGSVYFLEIVDGAFKLSDMWLCSVCDREQDRSDGFGLALWGRGEW